MVNENRDNESALVAEVRGNMFFFVVCLAVVGLGLGILAWQGIMWLRDGYWTDILVGDYIHLNNINWSNMRGLEKIVDGFLNSEIWLPIALLGAAFLRPCQKRLYQAQSDLSNYRERHGRSRF
jgi:hypothetical protein